MFPGLRAYDKDFSQATREFDDIEIVAIGGAIVEMGRGSDGPAAEIDTTLSDHSRAGIIAASDFPAGSMPGVVSRSTGTSIKSSTKPTASPGSILLMRTAFRSNAPHSGALAMRGGANRQRRWPRGRLFRR